MGRAMVGAVAGIFSSIRRPQPAEDSPIIIIGPCSAQHLGGQRKVQDLKPGRRNVLCRRFGINHVGAAAT